jgi:hypothetical protein
VSIRAIGLGSKVEINYQVFESKSMKSLISGKISPDIYINNDNKIDYEDGKFSFSDGEQSFQFTITNGFMRGEINAKYGFMCWSSLQKIHDENQSKSVNIYDNKLTGYYQGIGYNSLSPKSAERVIDVNICIKKDITGTHLVFHRMDNEPLSNDYPVYSLLSRSAEDKVLKFVKNENDAITLVLTDGVLRGTINRRFGNSYSFVCKPSLPIY